MTTPEAGGRRGHPTGDACYYLGVNRNKRSVALDLKDPGDLAIARRAIALRSDVVIENFRPGVMATGRPRPRDARRGANPSLVSCRILGIGRGDVAGYDFLAQAMGGLMSITGDADGEPRKIGVALVDVMAGLHAAIGILAALRHRDRTGEGQLVEVDLLSTTLFALANQASGLAHGGCRRRSDGESASDRSPRTRRSGGGRTRSSSRSGTTNSSRRSATVFGYRSLARTNRVRDERAPG